MTEVLGTKAEEAAKARSRTAAKKPSAVDAAQAEAEAQQAQVQTAIDAHGSLLEAISYVAAKTGTIEKKGFNNHFGYSYVTKDDIVNHLKPLLAEAGLIIIPIHLKTERSEEDSKGYRDLIVSWEMRIIHAPTGATMAIPWESESMDNQDKGFAKATTSAMKQFVQAIFDIPSGDLDTEHDAHSGQTREGGERQTARPSPSGGGARPSSGGAVAGTSTKQVLDFKETHGISGAQLAWAVEQAGGDKSAKIKDLDPSLRPAILANLERIVAHAETKAQEQQAAPDEQPAYDDPGPSNASPADEDIPF